MLQECDNEEHVVVLRAGKELLVPTTKEAG
jgi:hypothetical protein